MQDDRAERLAEYIRLQDDFVVESVTAYHHMGATITDAILQAGINYETTVHPRALHIKRQYPQASTTRNFVQLLRDETPEVVLKFRGKKPKLVLEVAILFDAENVQTERDLNVWLQDVAHVRRLKGQKGIGNKRKSVV